MYNSFGRLGLLAAVTPLPPETVRQDYMFRIRFFTPTFVNDDGVWQVGGELMLGTARLCFLADLHICI